jgi:hypothetical protein
MPLIIEGTSLLDTSFTLEAPGMPEITWNVTRLEYDAFHGRFGEPQVQRFDGLYDYGPGYDKWRHLDRGKVVTFMQFAARPCTKPSWTTRGQLRSLRLLDIPCIAVILPTQVAGVFNAITVDGNHRMMARELLGLPDFSRFVVPPELEGEYRVYDAGVLT